MANGARGLRWQAIPAAVVTAILLSWLLAESLGLVPGGAVLTEMRSWDRSLVALTIFGLLVADVAVPVPSTALIAVAGTLLGVPGGLLIAVAGSMVASLVAYLAGRLAAARGILGLLRSREEMKLRRWTSRTGPWVFALARGVPMLAETSGMLAGLARVAPATFLTWTLIGTVPTCAVYAVAGAHAQTAEQVVLVCVIGFGVAAGLGALLRRRQLA